MHANIHVIDEPKELYEIHNPVSREQVIELALNLQYKALVDRVNISSPSDTKKYFQLRLADKTDEVFSVMFLSTKHHVIDCVDMFEGTLDSCSVYVRKVLVEALRLNASAIIVAHNHPSGISEPSSADETLTKALLVALGSVSIRVLDHIIVGDGEVTSLAETSSLF